MGPIFVGSFATQNELDEKTICWHDQFLEWTWLYSTNVVILIKGDLFGMFDAVVYCQAHFRQQQEQQMLLNDEFNQSFYGFDDTNSEGSYLSTPSGLPGPWATSGSPGGPDSECNENNNSIPASSRKKRGRRKRDISEDEASRSCFPFLDPAGSLGEKSKRARTSFKHNQLRIMKSHFQLNQNPDSRELKELATKTGLDKKVLQVCIATLVTLVKNLYLGLSNLVFVPRKLN